MKRPELTLLGPLSGCPHEKKELRVDFANHILVATDFSEPAAMAVRAGATLATQLGARITLVHAFDPDALVPPGAIPRPSEYRQKISTEMTEAVTARLQQLREGELASVKDVDISVVQSRSPAAGLVDEADRLGVDLIIVATHGRTGLGHLLIGSVAEKVVRHAHCPVLAVRVPKA